jgi:hypothetical protein
VKTERLAIDWSELEMALTSRPDDGGHYFDLTTGEVVSFTGLDDVLAQDQINAGLGKGRLIPIEPLPSSVEYGWMSEFADSVAKPSLRRLLDVALNGPGAFRRFKDVLAAHPTECKRWFAFHDQRVREAAREWVEEHGIDAAIDPPRYRGMSS